MLRTQRLLTAILAIFCLLSGSSVAQRIDRALVLKNVTLIDGTGAQPRDGVSIVIVAGRISAIGKEVQTPEGAEVIDGTGKYVIPGLIDAAVQISASPANRALRSEAGLEQRLFALQALLKSGVTTTRLVQGGIGEQRIFQSWEKDDLLAAPRIIVSGPTFTAPDGYLTKQYAPLARSVRQRELREVVNSDSAIEMSRNLAHAGAEVFEMTYDAGPDKKPLPRISDEALRQLIKEAKGHELKTFCKVNNNAEATLVSEMEVDVIEGASAELFQADQLSSFKNKGTMFAPQLVQQADIANLIEESSLKEYLSEPAVQVSLSHILQKSLQQKSGTIVKLRSTIVGNKELQNKLNALRELASANVNAAKSAGIAIVTATGAGSTLVFPGASIHRELQLLVKAGLTPMEALIAATSNTAAALGKSNDVGTIEVGKYGDMVLLGKNPLEDIRNTQSVEMISKSGQLFRPSEALIY